MLVGLIYGNHVNEEMSCYSLMPVATEGRLKLFVLF